MVGPSGGQRLGDLQDNPAEWTRCTCLHGRSEIPERTKATAAVMLERELIQGGLAISGLERR